MPTTGKSGSDSTRAIVLDEAFTRILPKLTDANRHFWTGGADGRLMISRCQDCGRWQHPAVPVCPSCWSSAVRPEATSGRGRVWSFSVNHYQWVPGMQPPYVVAVVELDEQAGLRFTTNIVECAIDEVRCDMPVEVLFARHGEVYVPLFRPVRRAPEVSR
jgi:uncharacterized OB-fold protein